MKAQSNNGGFRLRARPVVTGFSAALLAVACSDPPPRSFQFFMEDSIARDGVLARCARDDAAAQTDIECANARRAALAVQLRRERERREQLERESEQKLEALRREIAAREKAGREAESERAGQETRSDAD